MVNSVEVRELVVTRGEREVLHGLTFDLRNEFQAVQFLPAFVLPQLLQCGLFAPRETMAPVLRWLSDVFPLTYAVDGMQLLTTRSDVGADLVRDLLVIGGSSVLALALGAATLRRQSA